jgi:hypothetical protein
LTSEDFNLEATAIANRFFGMQSTATNEALIKVAFQQLICRFYEAGGYLLDRLQRPILDVDQVDILVDRHEHEVSIVTDRKRKPVRVETSRPVTITSEMFERATGRRPDNDDLERANCPLAGQIGHSGCGWNAGMNKPQWECF